jgi:hypothetical protein
LSAISIHQELKATDAAERPLTCGWCHAPLEPFRGRLTGRAVCGACGVATTDPWPTEAELSEAYASWYRPQSGRFAGAGDRLLARARGALARRVDVLAPPGPVLDVGAGDGALIDALRRAGRAAVGLERTAVRADLSDRDLLEIDGTWAAVVFWHSLEHLRNPTEALDHAARLLVPGGLLVVAMPDAASLQARAFGDRWFALDMPRHLVHVPGAALRARVRTSGLEIQRVSALRGGQVMFGWLHGLVGGLPGRPDLYDAIRRPEARRSPVGAGARAVALATAMALTPIALACSGIEIAARRSGTTYLEARKPLVL